MDHDGVPGGSTTGEGGITLASGTTTTPVALGVDGGPPDGFMGFPLGFCGGLLVGAGGFGLEA